MGYDPNNFDNSSLLQDFTAGYLVNYQDVTLQNSNFLVKIQKTVYMGRAHTRESLGNYLAKYIGKEQNKYTALTLKCSDLYQTNYAAPAAKITPGEKQGCSITSGWPAMDSQEVIYIQSDKECKKLGFGRNYLLRGFEMIYFTNTPEANFEFIPAITHLQSPPTRLQIEKMDKLGLWASAGMAWKILGQNDRAFENLKTALEVKNLPSTTRMTLLKEILQLKYEGPSRYEIEEYQNELIPAYGLPSFEVKPSNRVGFSGEELAFSISCENLSKTYSAYDIAIRIKCPDMSLTEKIPGLNRLDPGQEFLSARIYKVIPNKAGKYDAEIIVEYTDSKKEPHKFSTHDQFIVINRRSTVKIGKSGGFISIDIGDDEQMPDVEIGEDVGFLELKKRKPGQ